MENASVAGSIKVSDLLGIYPTLSNDDYHSHNSISRSGMKVFNESPYKYWAHYINPNRPSKKSTKAMDFGSAFHTFVLERDKFYEEYVLEPRTSKLPKVGRLKDLGKAEFERQKSEKLEVELANKNLLEEFSLNQSNKKILKLQDWTLLKSMKTSLQSNSEAWELLQNAIYEQSYFWRDQESGLLIKARPDALHINMIVDLKTIVCADSRPYQRAMMDEWYHVQGAIIREGVRELEGRDIPNVINVCVEKEYPWEVGIKIISEQALDEGRNKYKKILLEMKEAIENNYFPSYEPETVDLPRFY